METYNPKAGDIRAYEKAMLMHGGSYTDSDGYFVYSQEGEGIGSFFGNLFKAALPILGRTIKAGASAAKPHLLKASTYLLEAGTKRLVKEIETKKNTRKAKRRRRI